MLKQIGSVILLFFVLAFSLVGCGSDNSGSISLGSLTRSGEYITTTAKYTPSSGPVLPNQEITFYWRTVGLDTNTTKDYPPEVAYTDGTGTALSTFKLPSPWTETLRVYVKAGTGDLITATQFVDVTN